MTVCSLCSINYFMSLTGNTCVNPCPSNAISDTVNRKCVTCGTLFPNCQTCTLLECQYCNNTFLMDTAL